MKPSERISKLCFAKNPPTQPEDMVPYVRAIIDYLDEQYEQQKYNLIRSVQVPGMISNGASGEWCSACGAWKEYGVSDTHFCTGYKVTC
jgi:hypothetical protein